MRLMPEELAAIGKRTTENVEAYQYYLMGRQHFLRLCRRVITFPPDASTRGHLRSIPTMLGRGPGWRWAEGMLLRSGDPSANAVTLRAEAERALALNSTLAEAARGPTRWRIYRRSKSNSQVPPVDEQLHLIPISMKHTELWAMYCAWTAILPKPLRAYEKAAEVDRNSYVALCMLWDCRKTWATRRKPAGDYRGSAAPHREGHATVSGRCGSLCLWLLPCSIILA